MEKTNTNSKQKKAVILARGLGSRMRAQSDAALTEEQKSAADAGLKSMISVGRPFLDHVISALADAGFTDVCLVIGPEHQVVRDYYDSLDTDRVTVSYAIQEEPLGTADAVLAAEEFAGEDPILVVNSDNYYPADSLRLLADHEGNAVLGFDRHGLIEKSNIPPERLAAFALLQVDEDGNMVDIVEKPSPEVLETFGDEAPISMNAWLFTPSIFAAAKDIELSERGELEIQSAVRKAIANGETFAVLPTSDGVMDMSSRDDIASVVEALQGREVSL